MAAGEHAVQHVEHAGRVGIGERGAGERVPQLGHRRRGRQAVPRHVADRQHRAAVVDRERVVPVAADPGPLLGREVAHRDLHAGQLQRPAGQRQHADVAQPLDAAQPFELQRVVVLVPGEDQAVAELAHGQRVPAVLGQAGGVPLVVERVDHLADPGAQDAVVGRPQLGAHDGRVAGQNAAPDELAVPAAGEVHRVGAGGLEPEVDHLPVRAVDRAEQRDGTGQHVQQVLRPERPVVTLGAARRAQQRQQRGPRGAGQHLQLPLLLGRELVGLGPQQPDDASGARAVPERQPGARPPHRLGVADQGVPPPGVGRRQGWRVVRTGAHPRRREVTVWSLQRPAERQPELDGAVRQSRPGSLSVGGVRQWTAGVLSPLDEGLVDDQVFRSRPLRWQRGHGISRPVPSST